MQSLAAVLAALPEVAADVSANLALVMNGPSSLSEPQRWGSALACAHAARSPRLVQAFLGEYAGRDPALVDDALAAAVLMAQNNVYFRFRHMVGKASYQTIHPRLRMKRVHRAATNQVDFELFALAVSALNGCESCIQHHERVVTEGGLTEPQVNDAIRIAACVHAAAIALDLQP